ncbi:uncharacterized protein LOC107046387 [Diachasma alloeum]|uniref:uncharacterized protein LOC107046387 n=1 Tax=Diachasma alloeum TaxID=454923 RepID=UPI0007382CDB|nr:uncharacterized protein LOC107046387 [Diachasma alloeum]
MCNAQAPWPEVLPTVFLGLRNCYKEDLNASPADLVFGTSLRVPGEFFVSEDMPADPQIFLEQFREHIRAMRPTTTAHHTRSRIFILKNLYSCSYVFLRIDAVKRPLEPPYSEPYEVLERLDDYVFKINVDGVEKVVCVDSLKPTYIAKEDSS